jgi:hypoxanthine-DNA glycosylase
VVKLIDHGFPPILGDQPEVLILGTMPSVASLQAQQYYGHPRNAFWWIMAQLFHFDHELPYPARVEHLKQNRVAVWDVIDSCHRPGSLDSRIDQETVNANDFADLFAGLPSLKLLAFNGQTAEKLFKQHVGSEVWSGTRITLPSTSPAHASKTREQKLLHWSQIKTYISP